MYELRQKETFHRNSFYTVLITEILEDPRLSLEGKATYALLESGKISILDVPENIYKELFLIGYIEEVEE